MLGAFLVIGFVFSIIGRLWKLSLACLFGLLIQTPYWLTGRPPSYRMTLTRSSGDIRTETVNKDNVVVSVAELRRSEMASSDMQFNRGDTRVVIVKKDGTVFYPLGEQYLQGYPQMYVVLNAIRQTLGQNAAPPQGF